MKCGEDDDGHSIRLRVWKYFEYMHHQTDDSPVYLFEGSFDDDDQCSALLNEYVYFCFPVVDVVVVVVLLRFSDLC